MKVELSEQDIIDTVGFLSSPNAMVPANMTLRHAVLVQTYKALLQPTPQPDGARPEEEIPAEEPTS